MATRATRALDAAGVAYRLHPYDYEADAAGGKGVHAALSLGVPPGRVLKTLMAWIDASPVCVVIPADRQLQPKALAAAGGGKAARMMEIPEAERRSGYKVGGSVRSASKGRRRCGSSRTRWPRTASSSTPASAACCWSWRPAMRSACCGRSWLRSADSRAGQPGWRRIFLPSISR